MIKKQAFGLLFFCFFQSIFASDLLDVYYQALSNDPTFKAAYSTFMANSEIIAQAQAALLPQLSVSALTNSSKLNINAGGPNGLDGVESFNSQQWVIKASQAVFNYNAWAQVQQAKASVKAYHATFNDAAQDLILRTARAYFDALLAKDTLNFAEAKKRANKRQLEQARQRFNVGLDTITSVYEAKAAYDQSIAQVIAAKNRQINQNENLLKVTNHFYEQLAPLRHQTLPLIKPEPDNVNEWVTTGLKQNYKLFAAKFNLEAARENLKAQSSTNWPTLAIEGNSTNITNSGSSNFFVPAKNALSSIALTMNYPIVQGGLVQSLTRQAQYQLQTSSEDLERIYREVTVNTHIAFNTINDGISKVKADRQTVISQQNSLQSTEAQFQVGTRTMVDVVNAQQRLFEAQEQLANDQYQFIYGILHLKYLAGTLSVEDLMEINSWLETTRINQLPLHSTKR